MYCSRGSCEGTVTTNRTVLPTHSCPGNAMNGDSLPLFISKHMLSIGWLRSVSNASTTIGFSPRLSSRMGVM